MDFELTDEQKMLRDMVKRFVTEKLIPMEKEYLLEKRKERQLRTRHEILGEDKFLALQQEAKTIGLWALWLPQEVGGAGLGLLEYLLITEELKKTFMWFEFGGDAPHVLLDANEYLVDNYLKACIRGEKRYQGVFSQTEPNAGADPAAMETTARWDGQNWILNGTKTFIGEAENADFMLLPAVTDKSKGHHGITLFVVDRQTPDRPGYRVSRLIETIADDWTLCELDLDDCPVPAENVVGEVGEGFIVAQKHLMVRGRLHHGGWQLGAAGRCLQMATQYALSRVTFGKPLADRQAIQWMLADSALDLHCTRWIAYHCAWKADRGEDVRLESAMVKLHADEMAFRVIDKAVQIHGAMGLTKETELHRFYLTARMLRVAGGPMEIMRMVIARSILNEEHQMF
ncbi:MAG: acyl-CoA dehydrogenase family protein [Desulfobacterales bacterium]|nr:acyl-CoA dehydrogenase family protein [Desulfobacterales bacterium]